MITNSDESLSTSGREVSPRGRAISAVTVIAGVLWLTAIVAAMIILIDFSSSPNHPGDPPSGWPAQSQLSRDTNRPTLVLFAHPRCPCTRASLGELELLLAQAPGLLSAQVVFVKPAGTAEEWADTGLCRRAASIPGVNVHRDDGGVEAKRFGSETSGQTVLYDRKGQLLFHGGITSARGHSGDNPGRRAITALARNEIDHLIKTPVFGCPLFETSCQQGGDACKK